jgi:hypothetical protein
MRLAILQKLNPPEIGKAPDNVLVFFKIWPFLLCFFFLDFIFFAVPFYMVLFG